MLCLSAVPGGSDPGPSNCGFDQLSWVTHPWFELTRGGPAIPVSSVTAPCSHGVDVLYWPIWTRDRGALGSTICPGQMSTGSEFPRCRPAITGYSGRVPRAHSVDKLSRATRTHVQGTTVSTISPGQLGLVSLASGDDQLSQMTHARLRSPGGSTSCPW